jgi:type II secretory pathway predicted ATPase ExeA
MDSANPFLLILSGLPHIQNRLNLNQHKPLTQRITSRYKLDPLTLEETGEYVAHHMKLAGASHEIFNQNAVMAIHNLTNGWMRPINQLATTALLAGFAQKADIIGEEIIRLAAEEICI